MPAQTNILLQVDGIILGEELTRLAVEMGVSNLDNQNVRFHLRYLNKYFNSLLQLCNTQSEIST